MTVVLAILLSLFISGIIIGLALGQFHYSFYKLLKILRYSKALLMLRKLNNLLYFALTPDEKLGDAQDIFFSHFQSGRSVEQMWSLFEEDLEYDYRSFVIKYNDEVEGIELNWTKWDKALNIIGLDFKIEDSKELTKYEVTQEVNINKNRYIITGDFNNENMEKKLFLKFSEIVNNEFRKNKFG